MLKARTLLIIACLQISIKGNCENYFDSLRTSLLHTPSVEQYDTWLNIAVQINHDSVQYDLAKLKTLALNNNNDYSLAVYNMYYAAKYTQVTGDYKRGLELALPAKEVFAKNNKTRNIIEVDLQIALYKLWNEIASKRTAKNNSILNEILLPTLNKAQQLKDTNLYVRTLNILGSYWIVSKKDYKQALDVFLQAEELLTATTDSVSSLTTLASIAILFADSNNEIQMLSYLNKYKQLRCSGNYLYGTGNLYRAISKFYFNKQDYTLSLDYAIQAYSIAEQMQQPEYLSLAAKRLYEVYLKLNDNTQALKYLELHTKFEENINRNKFDLAYEELNVETKERTILSQKFKLQQKNVGLIALASLLALGVLTVFIINKIRTKNEVLRIKTQEQETQLRLDEAVRQSEEDERKRISGNLHDSVVQKLVVLKMNMETMQHQHVQTQKSELLGLSLGLVDDATKEIRTLSHSLMPVNMESQGLAKAVKELISKIYVDNLKINVFEDGDFLRINTHAAIIAFRIIQECLQNALKHAMATEINIHLHCDTDKVEISVEDNGIGFDVHAANFGIGISNIRNRIQTLHGKLDIESTISKGSLIILTFPIKQSI
jgi:two-component system, NarL family, sensor kinase